MLNAMAPIGCHASTVGRHAWAWDKRTQSASTWSELMYWIPALCEEQTLEATLAAAPTAPFVEDYDYYVRRMAGVDNALALPKCLDATLAAATALPEDDRKVLRRAARWIRAGEQAGDESRSLNYLALVCALEALSQRGYKTKGCKKGFQRMMLELLPCYRDMEHSAAFLYDLRCDLAHEAVVFQEDWDEMPLDTERRISTHSIT